MRTRPLLFVLGLVCLAALCLAGCGSSASSDDPYASMPEPNATPLALAKAHIGEIQSGHVIASVYQAAGDRESSMQIDLLLTEGGDRISMKVTDMIARDEAEMVAIGSNYYQNDGAGWQAIEAGDQMEYFAFAAVAAFQVGFVESVSATGVPVGARREKLGGVDTVHYSVESDQDVGGLDMSQVGIQAIAKLSQIAVDYWVTEDGTPVRAKIVAKGEDESGGAASAQVDALMERVDDESIAIETPK